MNARICARYKFRDVGQSSELEGLEASFSSPIRREDDYMPRNPDFMTAGGPRHAMSEARLVCHDCGRREISRFAHVFHMRHGHMPVTVSALLRLKYIQGLCPNN